MSAVLSQLDRIPKNEQQQPAYNKAGVAVLAKPASTFTSRFSHLKPKAVTKVSLKRMRRKLESKSARRESKEARMRAIALVLSGAVSAGVPAFVEQADSNYQPPPNVTPSSGFQHPAPLNFDLGEPVEVVSDFNKQADALTRMRERNETKGSRHSLKGKSFDTLASARQPVHKASYPAVLDDETASFNGGVDGDVTQNAARDFSKAGKTKDDQQPTPSSVSSVEEHRIKLKQKRSRPISAHNSLLERQLKEVGGAALAVLVGVPVLLAATHAFLNVTDPNRGFNAKDFIPRIPDFFGAASEGNMVKPTVEKYAQVDGRYVLPAKPSLS